MVSTLTFSSETNTKTNPKTKTNPNHIHMNDKDRRGYPMLQPHTPVPTDIEISHHIVKQVGLVSMHELAKQMGLRDDEVIPWGFAKAKIDAALVLNRRRNQRNQTSQRSPQQNPTTCTATKQTEIDDGEPLPAAPNHPMSLPSTPPPSPSPQQDSNHQNHNNNTKNTNPGPYYVVVTGLTPTPAGEGKSTTTIGLAQALGASSSSSSSSLLRPSCCVACIRQPSLGPTFGVKGGAAGGGYAQVVPMDEFNLHLTGDIHAVSAANNLLAAAMEARMFHEASTPSDVALCKRLLKPTKKGKNTTHFYISDHHQRRFRKLGIPIPQDPASSLEQQMSADDMRRFARLNLDPESITWRRVVDICDRHLRVIQIGLGPHEVIQQQHQSKSPNSSSSKTTTTASSWEDPQPQQHSRITGFDIAVASEVMAVLALARDLPDLRHKLGAMVIGKRKRCTRNTTQMGDQEDDWITAEDVGVAGALTVLLKDALMPTLMQTIERTPVLVHAGPFANIAIGNSSIMADQIALAALESTHTTHTHTTQGPGYCVTEAGFGADIGMEKFFNIKCRASGLRPSCVVMVATIRALKVHGAPCAAGVQPSHDDQALECVQEGCRTNLARHIRNALQYGVPVVVAINQFHTDTPEEIELVQREAMLAGARAAVPSNHYALGGRGALDLAVAVDEACQACQPEQFRFLYELDQPIKDKIECIATKMYGAAGVEYSDVAERQIADYEAAGFGQLPICIAKTQYSFSCDPSLKGAPDNFIVPVREVRISAGAGFLTPICGDIMTIPGLPTRPGFCDVDIDLETGDVIGLF